MKDALLLQGNGVHLPIADGVCQLVCFSPPYWGLRVYDVKPFVWGGDSRCEHKWGRRLMISTGRTDGDNEREDRRIGAVRVPKQQGSSRFCQKCSAWKGQLGLEPTPEMYIANMMVVMKEVWRVLRKDGICFVNIGDSYAGGGGITGVPKDWNSISVSTETRTKYPEGDDDPKRKVKGIKDKSLCLVPQRFAIRCLGAGWIIRNEIIWEKPNPMPESVSDRCTRSHEQVWMMAKQGRYYWDQDAVLEYSQPHRGRVLDNRESDTGKARGFRGQADRQGNFESHIGGRNIRDVWTITTESTPEAHFATWPSELCETMIKAATSHKACPRCGAPWERIREQGRVTQKNVEKKGQKKERTATHGRYAGGEYKGIIVHERITKGWQPTCRCRKNDGSSKCVVLDPFCGTGKTVAEAKKLGRVGVGMDLSMEYLKEMGKINLDEYLPKQVKRKLLRGEKVGLKGFFSNV